MKRIAFYFLLTLCGTAPVVAQESAPPDSTLPTGTSARFWTQGEGWTEGFLARILPDTGGRCLGVFSVSTGAMTRLPRMDSLQVDTSSVNIAEARQQGSDARRVQPAKWWSVSPTILHARESGCDF